MQRAKISTAACIIGGMNSTTFFLIAMIALLCRLSNAVSLPAPPFVVNCGPQTDEAPLILAEAGELRKIDRNRLVHLPDVPYRAAQRFGYLGGEGYRHWHGGSRPSPGPQWESDLFATGRIAPVSYKFVVPAGMYDVTIGISDGDVHVAGQRIFDVRINDRVTAKDVDPIAQAGYKEPMMLSASVQVGEDKQLTVSFRGKTEQPPIVSAIWVTPTATDKTDRTSRGPKTPKSVRAVGSYDANLISWHRPRDFSITGFLVRRREQGTDVFKVITANPVNAHRWIDHDVQAGMTYDYQVGSLNEAGKVSWSEGVSATPRARDASALPIYAIRLPDEALRRLSTNIHEDHTERATFDLNGRSYPIEIRIRGASTRHAAKKSYRIRFTDESPLPRKVTYLKAEPMDHTMQQEKLSCDLFRAVGAKCSEATYVNVFINDRYAGVYLDMEPIRSPFKRNDGLDPDGTLIRASTFQHMHGFEELGDLRGDVGSLDQLKDFIERINRTPRGEFEQFVRRYTDWSRVMDYLALIVLTHRTEIEANDYFFYRAPDTGRWSFIPWDHNNGNFHVQSYRNRIGEPYIHVFPQTIQQLGWEPGYWYVLPSRIFHTPALRDEYLDRLEELTKTWLASGKLESMIDANYELLRDEYPRDPHRWPFTGSDPFESSAADLKSFVRQHARQLLHQIENKRKERPSNLVISEFSFGKKSGWIELHNRGKQVESLREVQLVTKDAAGNWRLSLRPEPALKPDEYRVIRVPYQPVKVPQFTDAEARERWEIERWRAREKQEFPGYSPDGGFVGLVRQEARHRAPDERADDDDRVQETMLDFFFYGRQPEDYTYGRTNAGFDVQSPTPGRPHAQRK